VDKNKALQVIAQHQNTSLVYARKEEIEEISEQFEPIVTVLEFDQSEFAPMGGGNFYPQKSAQNRIADATGVSFTSNCGTREIGNFHTVDIRQAPEGYFYAVGNYAVIGYAQGQRLKPDGTPRLSSVTEYEFNVVDRVNDEFLSDFTNKRFVKTAIDARKKMLALKKFATRRASTGAELAVIRELAGIPTAMKGDQIKKPMLFSQVVESTKFKLQVAKELMQTPDGRQHVANALFGTSQALFGPSEQNLPQAEPRVVNPEEPPSDITAEFGDGDLDSDGFDESPPMDERSQLCLELEQFTLSGILSEKASETVTTAINDLNTPIERLRDLRQKCQAKAAQQGGQA
jgi:hypothetical protein